AGIGIEARSSLDRDLLQRKIPKRCLRTQRSQEVKWSCPRRGERRRTRSGSPVLAVELRYPVAVARHRRGGGSPEEPHGRMFPRQARCCLCEARTAGPLLLVPARDRPELRPRYRIARVALVARCQGGYRVSLEPGAPRPPVARSRRNAAGRPWDGCRSQTLESPSRVLR